MAKLKTRVVTSADWRLVEKLFGDNGACGGCWCMSWRMGTHGKAWKEAQGEPNKRALKKLVVSDGLHAVMAFDGEEPCGWCSFGPRDSFPRLVKTKPLARDDTDGTWTVVCFFIPREWRKKGVATLLLKAATARAFSLGAREVEGIPAVPYGDGNIPAAFAWTGVPRLFQAQGFTELRRKGASRPIYVKE